MTGRAVRRIWVGAPALLTTLLVATVGVLALVVGLVGAQPASAATATYPYDITAYAYDAPARLSPPHSVAAGARGSPERPGVTSWVSSALSGGRGVAANTAGDVPNSGVQQKPGAGHRAELRRCRFQRRAYRSRDISIATVPCQTWIPRPSVSSACTRRAP